ncbi:MAG: nuclear transport factor 2 family protein [Ginsengibacter sp.]
MNINEEVIKTFFTAFAKLDYTTMQYCYDNDAIFNDPVFGILQGEQVRSMWKMLCTRAKDFSLEFNAVEAGEEYGTCLWTARYVFSKTGRSVINNVKAHMRFSQGKIIEHTDEFDLYKWSRQAFGVQGWLLGWSGFMKNKIRHQALTNLGSFKI